eukprot:scaffold435065_cov59-Attheya_sp.AAC.1
MGRMIDIIHLVDWIRDSVFDGEIVGCAQGNMLATASWVESRGTGNEIASVSAPSDIARLDATA